MAQCWSECVASMRKQERTTRRFRVVNGCLAVYYPLLATMQLMAAPDNWFYPVVNMLIGWLMYRLYLSARKREQFWRIAVHHGQRMLVETPERAAWHSKALDILMKL